MDSYFSSIAKNYADGYKQIKGAVLKSIPSMQYFNSEGKCNDVVHVLNNSDKPRILGISTGDGDDQVFLHDVPNGLVSLSGGEGNDTLSLPGKSSDWEHQLKDGSNIYKQGKGIVGTKGFETIEFQNKEPDKKSK